MIHLECLPSYQGNMNLRFVVTFCCCSISPFTAGEWFVNIEKSKGIFSFPHVKMILVLPDAFKNFAKTEYRINII